MFLIDVILLCGLGLIALALITLIFFPRPRFTPANVGVFLIGAIVGLFAAANVGLPVVAFFVPKTARANIKYSRLLEDIGYFVVFVGTIAGGAAAVYLNTKRLERKKTKPISAKT